MDPILFARTQATSLVSCTPLSSCFSPFSARSLRGEFLGCGHNLRPPGIRLRRKCKKVAFRIYYPRFSVRASSDLQSVLVVVAAVSVSVLTVVYFNIFRRKASEMSSQLFQQTREMAKHVFVDRFLESIIIQEKIATENKSLMDALNGIVEVSGDYLDQVHLNEADLRNNGSPTTNKLPFSSSDNNSCGAIDSALLGESEAMALSSLSAVLTEPGTLPDSVMDLKGYEQGIELASNLSTLMVKTDFTTASVPLKKESAECNKFGKQNHEIVQEGEYSSHSSFLQESVRQDLYTFYEGNLSFTNSVASLNGLKTLSSRASGRDDTRTPSLQWGSRVEGTEVHDQDFHHATEKFRRKIPIGCCSEGSLCNGKYLGKRTGLSSGKEATISHQGVNKNLILPPHPKEGQKNCQPLHLRKLHAYNRLLRDGRLNDCVELLEGMEKGSLLDMNNVYHTAFFRACKHQKAVREAFRFIKLIPNPTMSTFNMLMSVCASSQDIEGAFQVLQFVQEAGLRSDCKLYTTLISTCAKSGKVDQMFKVFHEMVNTGVEPNVHTYGALIDGCAKAGQVAKAFGAYGIMRSKNVKPDRVVFNALISACGQSGALARAFDVLAEMRAETIPIDPDHVTVGALMKACANAGQVDRAKEVYHMIDEYNIKGTPELYTIAVNSCSQSGDWEFACSVYHDMTKKGIVPDEMFISAMTDVAGHAGDLDSAFQILQEARTQGMTIGLISYSSLMGACSNAKNWLKALKVYEDMKALNLKPTVSTMNALITSLCDADQLKKALEVFSEMKRLDLCPNSISYSVLLVASEKKDDIEAGLILISQAKQDGVIPNLVMCRCLIAMCLRRFEKACSLGEPILSFNSVQPQINSKWTCLALMVYRDAITAGLAPTMEEFSQVLGCLQLPSDASLRNRLIENLSVSNNTSKVSNLCSLLDGFGEYDPRAFSLLEEAASLGIIPCVSFKKSPIVVDVRAMQIHTAEVYFLTVLKGLKYRLAAGVKLPNITILLPIEKTQMQSPRGGRTIGLAGRISQAIAALLRRLGLSYQGNESHGKIRINGVILRKWFQPKLTAPFGGKPTDLSSSQSRLSRGIANQQRNIRMRDLSLD